MIDKKTYLKLMRRLPLVKCPENIILRIFKACCIPTNYKKSDFRPLAIEIAYGMGCLIIIVVFFTMIIWSNNNQPKYYTNIAANSHLLVRQLTNGAYEIFTERIK